MDNNKTKNELREGSEGNRRFPRSLVPSFPPMAFNPSRYEHVYGVHLLDDLHNFFPEFMYDMGVFPGNTIVSFLQTRTGSLFPEEYTRSRTQYRLFQQNRRRQEYYATIPILATPIAVTPQRTPPPPTTPPPIHRTRARAQAQTQAQADFTLPLTTLFTTLFQTPQNLYTTVLEREDLDDLLGPVPVTPTRQQLANASILSSIEPAAEVVCPICQDHAHPSNQEWRILRHCSHRFHRPCIDVWFQQNVHCPVCRHDIREEP